MLARSDHGLHSESGACVLLADAPSASQNLKCLLGSGANTCCAAACLWTLIQVPAHLLTQDQAPALAVLQPTYGP
eukprot:1158059-Pelagomonas_calceolata.AAC.4